MAKKKAPQGKQPATKSETRKGRSEGPPKDPDTSLLPKNLQDLYALGSTGNRGPRHIKDGWEYLDAGAAATTTAAAQPAAQGQEPATQPHGVAAKNTTAQDIANNHNNDAADATHHPHGSSVSTSRSGRKRKADGSGAEDLRRTKRAHTAPPPSRAAGGGEATGGGQGGSGGQGSNGGQDEIARPPDPPGPVKRIRGKEQPQSPFDRDWNFKVEAEKQFGACRPDEGTERYRQIKGILKLLKRVKRTDDEKIQSSANVPAEQNSDEPDCYVLDATQAKRLLESDATIKAPVFVPDGATQGLFTDSIARPIEQVFNTWLLDSEAKYAVKSDEPEHDLGVATVSELRKRFLSKSHYVEYAWNLPDIINPGVERCFPPFLRSLNCNLLRDIMNTTLDVAAREICRDGGSCTDANQDTDVSQNAYVSRNRTGCRNKDHKLTQKEFAVLHDIWNYQQGTMMLADAGAITLPHCDRLALGTWISVYEGELGIVWQSYPSEEEVRKHFKDENESYQLGDWLFKVLRPGEAMYMPPGTIHAVFRRPRGRQTLGFAGHVLRRTAIEQWLELLNIELEVESVAWDRWLDYKKDKRGYTSKPRRPNNDHEYKIPAIASTVSQILKGPGASSIFEGRNTMSSIRAKARRLTSHGIHMQETAKEGDDLRKLANSGSEQDQDSTKTTPSSDSEDEEEGPGQRRAARRGKGPGQGEGQAQGQGKSGKQTGGRRGTSHQNRRREPHQEQPQERLQHQLQEPGQELDPEQESEPNAEEDPDEDRDQGQDKSRGPKPGLGENQAGSQNERGERVESQHGESSHQRFQELHQQRPQRRPQERAAGPLDELSEQVRKRQRQLPKRKLRLQKIKQRRLEQQQRQKSINRQQQRMVAETKRMLKNHHLQQSKLHSLQQPDNQLHAQNELSPQHPDPHPHGYGFGAQYQQPGNNQNEGKARGGQGFLAKALAGLTGSPRPHFNSFTAVNSGNSLEDGMEDDPEGNFEDDIDNEMEDTMEDDAPTSESSSMDVDGDVNGDVEMQTDQLSVYQSAVERDTSNVSMTDRSSQGTDQASTPNTSTQARPSRPSRTRGSAFQDAISPVPTPAFPKSAGQSMFAPTAFATCTVQATIPPTAFPKSGWSSTFPTPVFQESAVPSASPPRPIRPIPGPTGIIKTSSRKHIW